MKSKPSIGSKAGKILELFFFVFCKKAPKRKTHIGQVGKRTKMSFNNKVISKVQGTKCKQQNGAWESTKKLTQENCLIVSSHFLACKVTDVLYNLLFTCPPTGQHNQQHQQGITKVFCLGNSKVLHQFLYSVGNAVTQANHLRFNVSNLVTSFFQKHRRCK